MKYVAALGPSSEGADIEDKGSVYLSALSALASRDQYRELKPRAGIDFTSNDYLALASAPRMANAIITALQNGTPIGAGGSRLLRGNCDEHTRLEADAAEFFRSGAALFFSSGYVANFAILATLPQTEDLIVMDALVHASMRDGSKASRAVAREFRHNDAQSADDEIVRWRRDGGTGRVWIVIESIYSMDGDFAPLTAFAELADRHDAFIVVDEAHATGVYGEQGRGLTVGYDGRGDFIVVHTCGKALGAAGAIVTMPATIRDFMVNRCRPFIFGTAPSPLMAVAVREALSILRDEPERRERLQKIIAFAHNEVGSDARWRCCGSQILPFIVGDNGRAMLLARALQDRGYDVRGIRPPTVPQGTARLRISLSLNIDEDDIRALIGALREVDEAIS